MKTRTRASSTDRQPENAFASSRLEGHRSDSVRSTWPLRRPLWEDLLQREPDHDLGKPRSDLPLSPRA
jgi:hypothetical protein